MDDLVEDKRYSSLKEWFSMHDMNIASPETNPLVESHKEKIKRKLHELKTSVNEDVLPKVKAIEHNIDKICLPTAIIDIDHFFYMDSNLWKKTFVVPIREAVRGAQNLETLVNEDIKSRVKDIENDLYQLFHSCIAIKYDMPFKGPQCLQEQPNKNEFERHMARLEEKLDKVLNRTSSFTDELQAKREVEGAEGQTPDPSPAKGDAAGGNAIDKKATVGRKGYPGLEGENVQSIDACDGNTDYPSGDSSDDSYDRMKATLKYALCKRNMWKAQWMIDSSAWNDCIKSKDTDQIGDLLRRKKIPNNNLLNEANTIFDMIYVRNICDAVCQYIVQKSNDVLYVYPTIIIAEAQDGREELIAFVVILGKHTDIGNEFKLHIRHTNDLAYQENSRIKQREKESGLFDEQSNIELVKLTTCLREHSQKLMTRHTNVCRISCSGFKSVRFGKEDESLMRAYCITIYVYAKGLIPLGEDMLPSKLLADGYEALVDVREGFVELYTGNEGPFDNLNHLRIGCSIGGDQHVNKQNLHGTLGGFFDYAGEEFCFSSAHVFLTASEMIRLRTLERQLIQRSDSTKHVYQPHNVYHKPFGKGRMAVYTEGGNGKSGVDVLSILIENRNPKSGEFPKFERDPASDKTYSTGKVYSRDDIRSLLKKNNRRVMKYGCSTGWTTGTFRLGGAAFRAPHPVQDGNTQFSICLHNQFEIQSDTENDFASNSDSGALVFMEDNDELVAIGMVECGMVNEVCCVTPLDEVLDALGLNSISGLKQFIVGGNTSDVDEANNEPVIEEVATPRSGLSRVTSDVESIKDEMVVVKGDINDIKGGIRTILERLSNT